MNYSIKKNARKKFFAFFLCIFGVAFVFISYSYKDKLKFKNQITDNISIESPHALYDKLSFFEQVNAEKSMCFTVGNVYETHPVLYKFNFDTQLLTDSIDFSKLLPSDATIIQFHYLSKDSIFLFLMERTNYHERAILLTNQNAELKKLYKINSPLFSNKTPDSPPEFLFDFMRVTDEKLIINIFPFDFTAFDSEKIKHKNYPIIAYYDLQKDTLVFNKELKFPDLTIGYLPWGANFCDVCISPSGNPIIGFRYTPTLIEWDIEKNCNYTHEIKSNSINTILPSPNEIFTENCDTQPYYSSLNYNSFQKKYSRKISFPDQRFGNFRNILVFTDYKFNYLGETINSNYTNQNIANFQYIENSNSSENNFFFVTNKDIPKLASISTIKKEIDLSQKRQNLIINNARCSIGIGGKSMKYSSSDFINFANKRHHINDSAFVLFTVQENTCLGCVKYILNFFYTNKTVLDKKQFYLLYVSKDTNSEKEELKKFDFSDFKNFRVDTSSIYQTFHPYVSDNPRITFVKNNKVEFDSIYPSGNLEEMVLKAMELKSLKKQ